MNNKSFVRALLSLRHPLSIAAIVLLLLNDHWLRYQLGSWLTGKIGDFAWLSFAPHVCALVVAWIIPRTKDHEKHVGLVSIAIIGVWFAAAKTIAPVHALTTSLLDSIVGWHGGLGMDITDLWTLPALLVAWHVWQHSVPQRSRRFPLAAIPALALALVTTLATSCLPSNTGVRVLCQSNGTIYAAVGGAAQVFRSDDGLEWQIVLQEDVEETCLPLTEPTQFEIASPNRESWMLQTPTHRFRFVQGSGIYMRADRQPEALEIDVTNRNHDSIKRFYYVVGPFDAVYNPQTGRLIVAMGHEGVLVRSGQGVWTWVAVGSYRHANLAEVQSIAHLLENEAVRALVLFMLVFPITAIVSVRPRFFVRLVVIALWLIWLASHSELRAFSILPLQPVQLAFITGFNIYSVVVLLRQPQPFRAIRTSALLSCAASFLYLLPYALWANQTVPNYSTATTFSVMLGVAVAFAAYLYWLRSPITPK